MSFWRIVLAWLVMAAVPLQGLAATSMLFCAMNGHTSQETHGKAPHHHDASGAASAGHDHAEPLQKASADTAKPGALPDVSHACGVCGACGHSAAIVELGYPAAVQPLAQTLGAGPFVLIHSPPSPLPDKPPRA